MRIAIIDDGIIPGILPQAVKVHDLVVQEDGCVRPRLDEPYFTEHGTTCAAIITNYVRAEKMPEIYSICIFSGASLEESASGQIKHLLKTSCVRLRSALQWCLDEKIELVHMSVGTQRLCDLDELRPVTARMLLQGQLIVAAVSNAGGFTIPAHLGGVLGVIADEDMQGFNYRLSMDVLYGFDMIKASSRHRLTGQGSFCYETQVCNSYAAPVVTAALVGACLGDNADTNERCKFLAGIQPFKTHRLLHPDFIEDAAVIDLSVIDEGVSENGCLKALAKYFFFHCTAYCTSMEEWLCLSHHGGSVVLIPGDNVMQVKQAIVQIHRRLPECGGFLYCGRLTEAVAESVQRRLYWDERSLVHTYDDAGTTDFPLVCLYGAERDCIAAAVQVKEKLLHDGYDCVGTSSFARSYLYGFEYVKNVQDWRSAAALWQKYYHADIVIYCAGQAPEHMDRGLFFRKVEECDRVEDIVKEIYEAFDGEN